MGVYWFTKMLLYKVTVFCFFAQVYVITFCFKKNNNRVFVVSFSSLFSLKAPIRDATAVLTDMSNRSQIAASLSNVLMLAEDLRQSLCYGARNVAD